MMCRGSALIVTTRINSLNYFYPFMTFPIELPYITPSTYALIIMGNRICQCTAGLISNINAFHLLTLVSIVHTASKINYITYLDLPLHHSLENTKKFEKQREDMEWKSSKVYVDKMNVMTSSVDNVPVITCGVWSCTVRKMEVGAHFTLCIACSDYLHRS